MSAAIPDPVQRAAQTQPDAPAIVAPSGGLTYGELDRRVRATAGRLRANGLAAGDRLAIYRPTDADYLILLLAAFRAGVVVAPLNTRLPAARVPDALRRIACRTLVAGPDAEWDGFRMLAIDSQPGEHESTGGRWNLDAAATLVFTSGSTGTPKAALHTLGNHVQSAQGLRAMIPLEPGNRWLLDLPLYHVGGLAILFRCVLAGATVVLAEHGTSTADLVREHGVTHASFVATQLLRIVRDDASALAGMKAMLLGGSAIPSGLLTSAVEVGLPVHTSYGLTEMASTVTVTPSGSGRDALGTSGTVLPHRDVRLAADGEILVRGATLFAGYVEGTTVERPDAGDGWFPTGDLGAWTEVAGRSMLTITGRKDSLFISGGENVQPEEIEAALGRLPGVHRAVAVPIADPEFGQRPVAFVEADRWEPEAWGGALAMSLARYKLPVGYYPWPDGLGAGLKVSREALTQRARRLAPSS